MALLQGRFWDDNEDKTDTVKFFFDTLLDTTSMKLPVFGSPVVNTLGASLGLGTGGRGTVFRTSLETMPELLRRGVMAGSRLANEQNAMTVKSMSYAIGDVVSFFARVPVSKIIRKGERGYDQWQRGEGTPASIIFPRAGR